MTTLTSFEHQILIAMPSHDDSWFEKSVIYMVEDNQQGSMGIVLNKPHKLDMAQLLGHFKLATDLEPYIANQPVLMGGPVDVEHGFILHKGAAVWQKSRQLNDGLSITMSEDILKAIANNEIPDKVIATLGFSGWGEGQLAREMQANCWLSIPYNEALLFEVDTDNLWTVALNTLGISPEFLSCEAGRDC